jgi:hypothetical protein
VNYLDIRNKIELGKYKNSDEFKKDVIEMLLGFGVVFYKALQCYALAVEIRKYDGVIEVLNLAKKLGYIFRPGNVMDRENNPVITIAHYYGSNGDILSKTGYPHLCKTNEPINMVVDKIISSGLNVLVKHSNGTYIVYISDSGFTQR